MSINKYKPHILVIPEDDAIRQIANGFILHQDLNERAIQILPIAGGWRKVVDEFTNNYINTMRQYRERRIVLIIDFDGRLNERLEHVKKEIPSDLIDRVFILGVLSEPEELRADLTQSYETIGRSLSQDCSNDRRTVWGHNLLKHNDTELDRMISLIKPFLFN